MRRVLVTPLETYFVLLDFYCVARCFTYGLLVVLLLIYLRISY